MDDWLVKRRLVMLGALTLCVLYIWLAPLVEMGGLSAAAGGSRTDAVPLTVRFLDVGQGDAVFIETPDGVQVLIDGGPDGTVIRELGKVMSFFDRTIDVVVATHPDKDHIGGLVDVLERFQVPLIITTENVSDTAVSRLFEERVSEEAAEIVLARRGQQISLGASTTLAILYPESNPRDLESNASSVVAKLIHGSTAFMLTGDSPKRIEEYLVLVEGEHLGSDVLKVGHHGSRTSTSDLFLAEVQPTYAVISSGQDNSYGHPHLEVTDALFNAGVETFATAELGTITFYSDGHSVWVE